MSAGGKRSALDRLLDVYEGRITKKELKLMKQIVELATESDEVRRYRFKLDFIRRTAVTLAYFLLVYEIARAILDFVIRNPHVIAI